MFLLQPCIISITGLFNHASTIVLFFGVTVPCKTLSDKLQRFQNRAARVLTQSSYEADANQLIIKLGWDNLETRRQKLKAEMVYKSLNGLTPSYLSSKFIQRNDMITSYNLRTILKISLQFPCHELTITKKALATVVQSSGTVCSQL